MISKEQRSRNTENKLEHIANSAGLKADQGYKGRVPQKGGIARATHAAAYDNIASVKEHQMPNWKEK
jgi:hypothetical protein